MMKNKKGVAAWISVTLLVAFVVAIAALVSNFMIDYAEEKNAQIENQVTNLEICDLVSLYLIEVIQNPQALNIKLSNKNNIKIDELIFHGYIGYDVNLSTSMNVTIKPGKEKIIEVPSSATLDNLEVIPVVVKDGTRIICSNRKASKSI
jgi:hypothetical protein